MGIKNFLAKTSVKAAEKVAKLATLTPQELDDLLGRKEVYLVGDCRKVGNLRSVIWGAYETAMKI